jgi:hypothetical protein
MKLISVSDLTVGVALDITGICLQIHRPSGYMTVQTYQYRLIEATDQPSRPTSIERGGIRELT